MMVCEQEAYENKLVPMVNRLKFDYFGHECVIIHSRDIRKAQGDFGFLTDPAKRQPFYERINEIMSVPGYDLIASVIKKQDHKEKYGMQATNPYDLALTFALERLLPLLEKEGQTEAYLVAEARGKKEDDELRLSFLNIVTYGTYYNSADRFRKIKFHERCGNATSRPGRLSDSAIRNRSEKASTSLRGHTKTVLPWSWMDTWFEDFSLKKRKAPVFTRALRRPGIPSPNFHSHRTIGSISCQS